MLCQVRTKLLWTGSLRGEALTSAGGQQLEESDSLAQGRTGLCRPFERGEDLRCGHREVACVRAWSSAGGTGSIHSCMLRQLHTRVFQSAG